MLAVAGAALLVASLLRSRSFSLFASALVGALCLYTGLGRQWFVWPFYLLIPVLAATAVALALRRKDEFSAAARLGRLGRSEWGWIALISFTAALALILWVRLLEPDLSSFKAMLPLWPPAALVGAAIFFSLVNAVLEEFIWRGVLQRWLLLVASPALAVALQALSFGIFHFTGFPGGLVGMGLATLYGAMLGALALRSGGLLAPIVAHIGADLVIFTLVAINA